MSANWAPFLTDEGLTLPYDQWSDIPQTTTGSTTHPSTTTNNHPLSAMPKSTATSGSDPGDLSVFNSILNGSSFDDPLFTANDYFLSDFEILQPFNDPLAGGESTTESSPEPTSGIALTGPFTASHDISSASQTPASIPTDPNQSPLDMSMNRRPSVHRAQTFPNPSYESMFPNNMDSGFVEDLTFPDGPNGAASSSHAIDKTTHDHTHSNSASTGTTAKRNRNKPDIISACWTSPLCPNHGQDGPPPNPSNCGGGCAPFLFANDDNLPTSTINSLLPQPQEIIAEDGIVEIQPRPKKRSESSSSCEPAGRRFPSSTTPEQTLPKEEQEESPDTVGNLDDAKPKSRRRLPHNQVERKYRESLNTQLESLRRVVPALQQNQRGCDGADIEDLPAPSKPSKAVILASATAYIKQMEKDKKSLAEENAALRTRMKALQALVKCEDCSLMQYVVDLKINPARQ
ncbi:hypothetical protein BU24DRAFT_157890 [Aaosphaeria arxii CBS 175.79]|uniref:BHLH domain-containing protein n=1 Tax=Aaosphaeria arxii CBS 175.79 TaxID=1450172 RepID=A0A6A5XYH5_9PLEO|nr:uncharacterized protein BU24DRAFT_157890 [Aaosphaeria arxii CBS 175.79]KAF2017761.1 hypothetical protein BU24DRAFT_157890 [Aaosphaeria arxii CBS 175.79]